MNANRMNWIKITSVQNVQLHLASLRFSVVFSMQILHWKSGEFPEFCFVLLPPILNDLIVLASFLFWCQTELPSTFYFWAFLKTFCLKGLYYHALFRRLTFSCFRSIGNFFMGFFSYTRFFSGFRDMFRYWCLEDLAVISLYASLFFLRFC